MNTHDLVIIQELYPITGDPKAKTKKLYKLQTWSYTNVA